LHRFPFRSIARFPRLAFCLRWIEGRLARRRANLFLLLLDPPRYIKILELQTVPALPLVVLRNSVRDRLQERFLARVRNRFGDAFRDPSRNNGNCEHLARHSRACRSVSANSGCADAVHRTAGYAFHLPFQLPFHVPRRPYWPHQRRNLLRVGPWASREASTFRSGRKQTAVSSPVPQRNNLRNLGGIRNRLRQSGDRTFLQIPLNPYQKFFPVQPAILGNAGKFLPVRANPKLRSHFDGPGDAYASAGGGSVLHARTRCLQCSVLVFPRCVHQNHHRRPLLEHDFSAHSFSIGRKPILKSTARAEAAASLCSARSLSGTGHFGRTSGIGTLRETATSSVILNSGLIPSAAPLPTLRKSHRKAL